MEQLFSARSSQNVYLTIVIELDSDFDAIAMVSAMR